MDCHLLLKVDGNKITVKNKGKRPVDGATIKIKPKKPVLGAIKIVVDGDTAYAVLPRIEPGAEIAVYL